MTSTNFEIINSTSNNSNTNNTNNTSASNKNKNSDSTRTNLFKEEISASQQKIIFNSKYNDEDWVVVPTVPNIKAPSTDTDENELEEISDLDKHHYIR